MHKQTERYQKSNVNLLTWLKGPHDIIGKWWNLIWFNSVIIYWLSLHGPTRQWRMHEEEDRVYTSGDATLFLETQSNYPDFSLVANAPVLRCRSHFFLQVSWWVRALKWSCTQEGGAVQELRPQFLPARPARHPFSFPPSSQSEVGSPARHYAGRRMTEPVGLLFISQSFLVTCCHLRSWHRALHPLCPWSVHKCLLIPGSNLWMRNVCIFNKQTHANELRSA